jgi:predicted aspartyl protease
MTYQFEKDPVNGLIFVFIEVGENHKFRMMLDTGASNTTFDINALLVVDYPIGNIIETSTVETASGMMEVDIIQTKVISAFGHIVQGMKVQIYDFLKHGIMSDYDGLLGLDFFKNTKFAIDMNNQTIEVNQAFTSS